MAALADAMDEGQQDENLYPIAILMCALPALSSCTRPAGLEVLQPSVEALGTLIGELTLRLQR